MSIGGILAVTGGIHAGASVLLSDGRDVVIGNGANADFVLVDDGVAARHATVRLSGNRLALTSHHDGVRVFGHVLASGKTTLLREGAWFALGGARMQFSGRDALTPEAAGAAELAWLIQHAPLAWVAKRWARVSRGAKFALGIALIAAGAAALWHAYGPRDVARSAPKLDGPFRYVRVHEDPKTHAYVYDGYVANPADLASLAALVRRDACASVMRVVVIDQIREQLADFLTRYYRGAQLKPGVPGAFIVVPPAEDGYLLPESWDYARVARLAYESINGLRDLGFEGQVAGSGPVRAPLRAIGMNLARSAHGAWLVDARGVRFFPGAQLPLGRVTDITGCTVTIVRNDDGTRYELFSPGGERGGTCD